MAGIGHGAWSMGQRAWGLPNSEVGMRNAELINCGMRISDFGFKYKRERETIEELRDSGIQEFKNIKTLNPPECGQASEPGL
jgi:hypothetical protein